MSKVRKQDERDQRCRSDNQAATRMLGTRSSKAESGHTERNSSLRGSLGLEFPVARQGQNCREATCSGHAGPQRWSPGRRRAGDCGARPASARPGSRGTVSTRPDPDGTAAPSRRAGTCRGPRDAGSQVSSALRAPPATVGAPCTWLWPRTPASSDADAPGPLASGLHS